MQSADPSALIWRKSSFSESVNCVEVAIQEELVLIRDSKNRNGGMLSISFSAWREFLQMVRSSNIT
jgi:hypothetical protein